jgi:preprotein translocase subunit SecF
VQWYTIIQAAIGTALTDTISRLIQFVITKALPYIFKSFGYGTWFFFASWMMLATIWSFFFLPETKGRTLDEMDQIL